MGESTTNKTLGGPRGGLILCRAEQAAAVDKAVFPGMQGGPLMHVVAAKAIAFKEALDPSFRAYAAQTIANARTVAHELSERGFRLVSGGTDNHLMLVDVNAKGYGGKQAEKALDAAGITVNRNGIPFDTRPPLDPSGLRIGPRLSVRQGHKRQCQPDKAQAREIITISAVVFPGSNGYTGEV